MIEIPTLQVHGNNAPSYEGLIPYLVGMQGVRVGRAFHIDKPVCIGRDLEAAICIQDGAVSRQHAMLTPLRGHVYIQDLNSQNGTLVNGERVRQARLRSGDRVQIGRFAVFKFVLEDELERQLCQARRQDLQTANEELEAFAFSVSHDLRAPLRAIDGFSNALIENCGHKLDEHELDYLKRVVSEAQRMSQLIDDLLTLSRCANASTLVETGLSEMAVQITDQLRHDEPERNVEVVIAEDLFAVADPRLVRQALLNLLSNAWKFTARCQKARIEVGLTVRNGAAAFFVSDNGVGFDMAFAHRLFTPFQRLHASGDFPGTGIGLSIVRRIVTHHGGEVWCESEVGRGTTFFFTLVPAMSGDRRNIPEEARRRTG